MTEGKKRSKRTTTEIGWREYVGLPDLGAPKYRAKIDTGARTSALHATNQRPFRSESGNWVEFHIPVPGTPRSTRCKARVVERRNIKNTSGIPEERYIIKTTLVLGSRRWPIELSLADRENMGFDLILGRTAVRQRRLLIDPGRSYLAGMPSVSKKKSA
jgi:hypothetical protein